MKLRIKKTTTNGGKQTFEAQKRVSFHAFKSMWGELNEYDNGGLLIIFVVLLVASVPVILIDIILMFLKLNWVTLSFGDYEVCENDSDALRILNKHASDYMEKHKEKILKKEERYKNKVSCVNFHYYRLNEDYIKPKKEIGNLNNDEIRENWFADQQ